MVNINNINIVSNEKFDRWLNEQSTQNIIKYLEGKREIDDFIGRNCLSPQGFYTSYLLSVVHGFVMGMYDWETMQSKTTVQSEKKRQELIREVDLYHKKTENERAKEERLVKDMIEDENVLRLMCDGTEGDIVYKVEKSSDNEYFIVVKNTKTKVQKKESYQGFVSAIFGEDSMDVQTVNDILDKLINELE